MKKITFRYKDVFSHGNWNQQECVMESLADCIEWYGLGVDCEYEIISVEEV